MKKTGFFIVLLLVMGMGSVCAQVADTTYGRKVTEEAVAVDDDEIVGSTSDLKFSENVPLAGSRALRQLEGIIVPNNKLSTHFLEGSFTFGFEGIGLGANYAYVPKRWGAYGSYVYDVYSQRSWFSAGAEIRVVMEPSAMDWHLYAGPAYGVGKGLGYELGTRFALGQTENTKTFAWTSFSLGVMHFQDVNYIMVGASVSISLLILLVLL